MKKRIVFLLLSTAFSWLASAKQVEGHLAAKVAVNFFASSTGMIHRQALPAPVLVFTSNDLNPPNQGTYNVGQAVLIGIKKNTTGVEDKYPSGKMLVYPNPAKDEIFIKDALGDLVVSECVISTLDGRQLLRILPVKQNVTYCIPVSNLTNGLCMMTVITGNGPVTRKIVINR